MVEGLGDSQICVARGLILNYEIISSPLLTRYGLVCAKAKEAY